MPRPPHGSHSPRRVASQTPFVQLQWSSEGELLAALDTRGRLAAWREGHLVAAIELDAAASCRIAVRPGGVEVAVARPADTSVAIVDVDRGGVTTIIRLSGGGTCDLAWSPDGRRLAAINRSGWVDVFDVAGRRFEGTIREAGMGTSTRVAWSQDGARIATLVRNVVRVWDANSLEEIAFAHPVKGGASPLALAFGSCGVVGAFEEGDVFIVSDGGDLATSKLFLLRALALDSSGTLAVACTRGTGERRNQWTLACIVFPGGRLRHALCGLEDQPITCAYGPAAHVAASLVWGEIAIWETERGERVRALAPPPSYRPVEIGGAIEVSFEATVPRPPAVASLGATLSQGTSPAPGTALWSRRFYGTASLHFDELEGGEDGRIGVAGNVHGRALLGPSTTVERGSFVAVLDERGQAEWAMSIDGGLLWPQLALWGDRVALAGAFQNTVTMGGRRFSAVVTQDILLSEHGASGKLLTTRQVGLSGMGRASALYFDREGRLVLLGQALQKSRASTFSLVIDERGEVMSRLASGSGYVHPSGAAPGPDGGIVLWGHYQGEVSFGGSPLRSVESAFVARLGPNDEPIYAHSFGELHDGLGWQLTAAPEGGAFAIAEWGTSGIAPKMDTGFALTKLDPSGAVAWRRFYPGPRQLRASPTALPGGEVLLRGVFNGELDLGVGLMKSRGTGRCPSPFLARLDAGGQCRWSRVYADGKACGFSRVAVRQRGERVTALVIGSVDGGLDLGAGEMAASERIDAFLAELEI